MKVEDIIRRVRTVAGDIEVLQFTDENIIQWINDAMREIASDNQLLQKAATSNTVADQAEYDIPADILKFHSVMYDGSDLNFINFEEAKIRGYLNSDTGTPAACWVWAGKLTLYPTPSEAKPLKLIYTRNPTEVAGDQETPEIPQSYHMRLVDYCLAQVAQQDDDINRYQLKMEEFRTGVYNLKDQPEWENNQYPYMSVGGADRGYYDGEY